MTMEAKKKIDTLSESFSKIFKFLKMMKREEKVAQGGKCILDIGGRLGVKEIKEYGNSK